MAEGNVEIIRRAMEAWNRGDIEASLELADPEVEWTAVGAMPDATETYHGHEGVREFFRIFMDPWERISLVAEEFIESGDLVVALGHCLRRKSQRGHLRSCAGGASLWLGGDPENGTAK